MTAVTRHRTAREKAALESARIAVERAQAHARNPAPEPRQPVEPPAERPKPDLAVDTISPTTAWRRRCVEIREEIERERRSSPP